MNVHTCLWFLRILVHKSVQESDDCKILKRVSTISDCFTLKSDTVKLIRKQMFKTLHLNDIHVCFIYLQCTVYIQVTYMYMQKKVVEYFTIHEKSCRLL